MSDMPWTHYGTRRSSAELTAAAEAKRTAAQGISDRAGVADRAAGRLSAPGLAQAHRNTDSSLRRYTEATEAAAQLDHKAALARAREQEASRPRLTHDDIKGATHVRDRHGWHQVVRVSAKSVTVKTAYSWNDSIAIGKILQAKKPT